MKPNQQTDPSLKRHGDKLEDIVGRPDAPREQRGAVPEEESLKDQGDKLQTSVDKATGAGGGR